MRVRGILFGVVACLLGTTALAADWPQWRGPSRNGISAEKGWISKWSGAGPRKLWAKQLGEGFASVAVAGGRLYTMGNLANQDTVYCFDAVTGKPVWHVRYPCSPGDYGGPRATPTISANKVYTLSREGQAFCFDAMTGKIVWQRHLQREGRADVPRWGFASSPLIEGNLVIYNLGASGAAMDKNTGKPAWFSGNGAAGYASPVSYTVGNQHGVALFAATGIIAVNPVNGRPYWQHPWNTQYDVNAADPIFVGNQVFISSNYDRGCALLNVGGARPSVAWENRNMRNHFNSCILLNGALYGNDQNTLKCLDLKTGAERWQMRGLGKGGLISADGKLIVLTERGELLCVAATPTKYTELARAQVMGGTCWTHPVLANGLLYCRSHEGELICLDLRGK